MISKRGHQFIGYFVQVIVDSGSVEVVEDEALRAERRTLDHHAGAACDEEERHLPIGKSDTAGVDGYRHLVQLGYFVVGGVAGAGEDGNQTLAGSKRGHGNGMAVRRDIQCYDTKARSCLIDCHMRTAVRPPAGQRHIDAHAVLTARLRGKLYRIQEPVRQIGEIDESRGHIVDRHGVHRLDLETADAAPFHSLDLTLELGLNYTSAEPPPAHHRTRIVGRFAEALLHGSDPFRANRSLRCGCRGTKAEV